MDTNIEVEVETPMEKFLREFFENPKYFFKNANEVPKGMRINLRTDLKGWSKVYILCWGGYKVAKVAYPDLSQRLFFRQTPKKRTEVVSKSVRNYEKSDCASCTKERCPAMGY